MSNIDKDLFNQSVQRILYALPTPGILLLSGKNNEKENLITIGWLQFGVLWNEPTVNVFIRQSRYTHELLKNNDDFTLNLLPLPKYEGALNICASTSGSYCDKFKEAKLTKIPSKLVSVSSLAEAELIMECSVIFRHNLDEKNLSDIIINKFYNKGDYHQLLTAKILNIKDKL